MTKDHKHIYSEYDKDLKKLQKNLLKLAGFCQVQTKEIIDFLYDKPKSDLEKIITLDKELNRLNAKINTQATKIIALRQPVAVDLRRVISSIQISSDFERYGDYIKNIARKAGIANSTDIKIMLSPIRNLLGLVQDMLDEVILVYNSGSFEDAKLIVKHDEDVNLAYISFFREILTHLIEDPKNISKCIFLIFIAKHIERMGDLLVNIAKKIYYQETGKSLKIESGYAKDYSLYDLEATSILSKVKLSGKKFNKSKNTKFSSKDRKK